MNSEAPQIKSASHSDGVIDLQWSDDGRDRFHCIWLRDACRCEICGDPAIGYRNLRLSALDLEVEPSCA